MNHTIGHVVLRSRKYPPFGCINAPRRRCFRELKNEETRWDGAGAGARNWSGRGLYTLGNRISQRASRAEEGDIFQNLPLSTLETLIATILVHAGTCRRHLRQITFGRGHRFVPIPFPSTRSFSSNRALCTDSREDSAISEAAGAQRSSQDSLSPTLSETLPRDGATLAQTPIQVRRERVLFAQRAGPRKPRSREELQTLIMFLEELSDPSEIMTLDSLLYHYRALPAPRIAYLRVEEMNLFLSRFMSVPVRTDLLMTRFLSIVDDMRESKIPITRREWITVMSYVGQRFNIKVGLPEIEATLKLWQELEKRAGSEPGPTIFNILLDMARKANEHNLVNAILTEMKHRKVEPDRFTLTTMITWYGILREAAAVRQTFTEMVQNGEVVDTAIYNALIVAFMRAGEWDTAEEIFDRMKSLGTKIEVRKGRNPRNQGLDPNGSPLSPSRDYAAYRKYAKVLKTIAKQHRRPSAPSRFPFPGEHGSRIYCGPNVVTFNIFLHNHCRQGDFEKATKILTEMKRLKIPLEPSIFLSLFRGFALHGEGRAKRSKWTRDRIEEVYAALLREVYQEREKQSHEVRLSTALACETVKAFAVTTRSRAKTIKVFRDMEYLYQQGYGHHAEIDPVVQRVLHKVIGGPIQYAGAMYPIDGNNDNQTALVEVNEDRLRVPEL